MYVVFSMKPKMCSTRLRVRDFSLFPVPANLQFAGVEYGDLQSLSMAEAFMAVISFSAANIAVFSEKQGRNVCVFPHCKC